MRLRVERAGSRLRSADRALASLSPVAILERGYAIVSDAKQRIVRDAATVKTGQPLRVRLHKGHLDVQVESASE
ncbi:MAG: exodeoxyribonuclease VII large subunit [Bryobacterales bacterium]